MAIDLFKGFENKTAGESFRCTENTPEVYTMEWIVQPEGYVPLEHIHYKQDEIFHVQKGEIRLVIEGKETIGKAGDTVIVPKGKAHVAYNNSPDVLQCIVQYKPALDQGQFFKCFGGLINDGYIDKKGSVDIPRMGYMLKKMKIQAMTRPVSIPAPMFKMALNVFYLRGILSGWGKLYNKYTTDN